MSRIVEVAVRIADARGLDALAMRHVAAELGVATMSLYHYVRGKDELVEYMIDAVFAEQASANPPTDKATGWHAELETWARREWDLLSRHPWVLRVITTFPPTTTPTLLTEVERVISALVDAGLDPIRAHQAFQSVTGLVEGLTPLRENTKRARRQGFTHRWRTLEVPALLQRHGAGNYPTQSALVDSLDSALDVDQMFEFGLARLLDGIEQFLIDGTPHTDEHDQSPETTST